MTDFNAWSAEILEKAATPKVAGLVLDGLRQFSAARHGAPIQLAQLSYRVADNYFPILVARTAEEDWMGLDLVIDAQPDQWIELKQDESGPECEELLQRIEDHEDDDASVKLGQKFVRGIAKAVNAAISQSGICVTPDFFCFAYDGEMEFDGPLPALKACGATKEQLTIWKRNGWV